MIVCQAVAKWHTETKNDYYKAVHLWVVTVEKLKIDQQNWDIVQLNSVSLQ